MLAIAIAIAIADVVAMRINHLNFGLLLPMQYF